MEEDRSIIQLIISMPIFSPGSGDVGQSVLDPDWNTLASMDFHYAWFAEDESFLKYGYSWQKYCTTDSKQMPCRHFAPVVIIQVALWKYEEKWQISTFAHFLCIE